MLKTPASYADSGYSVIRPDDFLRDFSSRHTAVHRLLFDVAVRLRFIHRKLRDEQPFGVVDDADFLHFFLEREGVFFHFPQALARAGHPVKCGQNQRAGERQCISYTITTTTTEVTTTTVSWKLSEIRTLGAD